ncbi:PepSY-associated TM helix domain-containing protein [Salinicola avicenniae]|uniref:PepSY-associated TM helix domain-containing protein n=1 Tax=Salinicola avicenniae TaxID=2916836 RepID=UPI0020734690|nr:MULTISPECIES: PepSY-associated TM helix domain-containing protein [unclassified Salinicola]
MTNDAANARCPTRQLLADLITRLHFYIGLFVGPFLLVAALSGIAYALTPQLENWLYHEALTSDSQGSPQALSRQIAAAQAASGLDQPAAAVRPSPGPGQTTRVMFAGDDYGASEHLALFVDPVTLAIRGDMPVYGTSGVLPLRTAIDQFHRGLLLGDIGRLYSELAASWLWVAALGGGFLWWQRRRGRRASGHLDAVSEARPGLPSEPKAPRLRRRHATLGLVALVGLLFFSATGLTWSQHAGGNIAQLRHLWGWGTPSVSTDLSAQAAQSTDPHAGHHATMPMDPAQTVALTAYDQAYAATRAAGLTADKIEMTPPTGPGQAWKIREIGREWPTEVDQLALDPRDFSVTDRTDFTTFPMAAKLTRWGIDLHMGVLFGLPNQLVLIAFAGSLATLVCWGYAMWWRRRPAGPTASRTLFEIYRQLGWRLRLGIGLVALAFGIALPVMGISLLAFLAIDAVRWHRRPASAVVEPT